MRTKKRSEKAQLLRGLALFRTCSDKELQAASELVDETQRPAGTVLMEQGRPGFECFVLVSGQATVARDGDVLATLGPGEVIGVVALLDTSPRSATVTLDTDAHLLVLDSRGFDRLLEDAHVAKGMLRSLAHRLRELEGRTA